jgi:hypothetical protein
MDPFLKTFEDPAWAMSISKKEYTIVSDIHYAIFSRL